MNDDPRLCPVCKRFLLRRDTSGFVLILRCDQCNQIVHERCYLEHHMNEHELIAIILEEDVYPKIEKEMIG
ncbi:MAG: hypothetical protein ACTSR2_08630 [Candidatus Hodarchaeales archaeon]